MAPKFSVGKNVKVTDQRPAASGTIEQVSTWREVLGSPNDSAPCYFIRCESWQNTARWIGECFVEAA